MDAKKAKNRWAAQGIWLLTPGAAHVEGRVIRVLTEPIQVVETGRKPDKLGPSQEFVMYSQA